MQSLLPRSRAALIAAFGLGLPLTPAVGAIDPAAAAAMFDEAKIICSRDGGALWGRSLCGPMMLVDPTDRSVVANATDAHGVLKPAGRIFTGTLPVSENIANTATEWSGTRWTQIIWPPRHFAAAGAVKWNSINVREPSDTSMRHVMIAHELFHRIQPSLGLTRREGGNRHLDTLEGRYLLQLEWRALAKALAASNAGGRRMALADALLFRSERYRIFPDAPGEEGALEINEGVPEYTGVKLGLKSPRSRRDYAIYNLFAFVKSPTFVRSFAYATGAAYGLLLDQADPAWRKKLGSGRRLDELLSQKLKLPAPAHQRLKARQAAYDDGTLRAHEVARESERQVRIAELKAMLVDGPVLSVPLDGANFQFNPQTLQALGDLGTVYPTVRVSGDWGVLEVEKGGALFDKGMSRAAVSAAGIDLPNLKGTGWRLVLNKGWVVEAGSRRGDFIVKPSGDAARK